MKNIFLAILLVFAMGLGANAQYFNSGRDGFFNDWDDISNGLDRTTGAMPALPYEHGLTNDVTAPLGSGFLILGAMGLGYALKKKRN